MHSIAFQPGEVWFLNPNMLAHEVVYGRRVMDGVFLFEAILPCNCRRATPEASRVFALLVAKMESELV